MSAVDLANIRARCDNATAATEAKPTLAEQLTAWFDDGPRKVAESAADVPRLLDLVDRLHDALADCRDALSEWSGEYRSDAGPEQFNETAALLARVDALLDQTREPTEGR